METVPGLRVSSNRLDESGIELGTLGTRRVVCPLHHDGSS